MKNINKRNTRDTNVIGYSDLLRIRGHLIGDVNQEDVHKLKDAALKEKSDARVKKWKDSIEMAKKNQLEARKKLFFKQEEERRQIDEEERRYNEMQKKYVVDRANQVMFENQENVKAFQSAMMLSDAIKEREMQKEIAERKKEHQRMIEEKWNQVEADTIRQFDLEEKRKADELARKKQETIKMISKQFDESKIKRVIEYQDAVVEGEMIKRKVQKELEEEKWVAK